MEEEKRNLDRIPSRVKYYLLEWKDKNMDQFIRKYGQTGLNYLTPEQLKGLFEYATSKDLKNI